MLARKNRKNDFPGIVSFFSVYIIIFHFFSLPFMLKLVCDKSHYQAKTITKPNFFYDIYFLTSLISIPPYEIFHNTWLLFKLLLCDILYLHKEFSILQNDLDLFYTYLVYTE